MGKTVNASQMLANWKTGVSGGANKYKQGISNVQQSPTAKAAAQVQVWAQNTLAAQDKYVAGLQSVSLQSWQTSAMNSVANYTNGVNKGAPKFTNFANQIAPVLSSISSQLDSQPRGSYEQNLARARTVTDALKNFSYQKRTS